MRGNESALRSDWPVVYYVERTGASPECVCAERKTCRLKLRVSQHSGFTGKSGPRASGVGSVASRDSRDFHVSAPSAHHAPWDHEGPHAHCAALCLDSPLSRSIVFDEKNTLKCRLLRPGLSALPAAGLSREITSIPRRSRGHPGPDRTPDAPRHRTPDSDTCTPLPLWPTRSLTMCGFELCTCDDPNRCRLHRAVWSSRPRDCTLARLSLHTYTRTSGSSPGPVSPPPGLGVNPSTCAAAASLGWLARASARRPP